MRLDRVSGAATTILLGGAFVVGMGLLLHQHGAPPQGDAVRVNGVANTLHGQVKHVFLNLSTYPDSLAGEHGKNGGPEPDWVSYGPTTSLHLPAHSLVTMTIRQYDSGEPITNPWFAKVHGTLGGTATVNGKKVTQVDSKSIGHTFTLHAAPTAQDPIFVSVPLPALPDDAPVVKGSLYAKPNVVRFSFMTKGPGKYVWNCEFPCGDGTYAKFGGPMAARGYMSGTLTVA
jgi:hypothetical protein